MTELIPDSRLLRWCRRLALLFLFLIPFSVASVRFEWFHFSAGLGLFALACLGSLLLLTLLMILAFLPRYRPQRNRALVSALFTLPPVVIMLAAVGGAGDYPAIHSVTTNPEDPPQFVVGKLVRKDHHNSLEIRPEVVAIQREAYPDIVTIESALSVPGAFELAELTANSLGWEVYNREADKGLLEASVTSDWFGFVDDVVIEVRPRPGGCAIELHSVSRVGRGDLGANANRIRAFRDTFKALKAQ